MTSRRERPPSSSRLPQNQTPFHSGSFPVLAWLSFQDGERRRFPNNPANSGNHPEPGTPALKRRLFSPHPAAFPAPSSAERCSGIEELRARWPRLPSKIIPESALVVWNKLPKCLNIGETARIWDGTGVPAGNARL